MKDKSFILEVLCQNFRKHKKKTTIKEKRCQMIIFDDRKRTDYLFDLDGTLTDPGEGITNSVMYSLRRFGIEIEEKDRAKLYPFIGPPLYRSYMKYYGFSRADAEKAVSVYREYFSDKGLFENELYPGCAEMLAALSEHGRVFLATSKPAVFARKILSHFDLARYFTFVAGSELDGRRIDKAEVIGYVLSNGGAIRENSVMTGDRSHDILGAKAAGIPSVGVLYGYGNEKELRDAGADFIVSDLPELAGLLADQ